jgi:hypothetical protein
LRIGTKLPNHKPPFLEKAKQDTAAAVCCIQNLQFTSFPYGVTRINIGNFRKKLKQERTIYQFRHSKRCQNQFCKKEQLYMQIAASKEATTHEGIMPMDALYLPSVGLLMGYLCDCIARRI